MKKKDAYFLLSSVEADKIIPKRLKIHLTTEYTATLLNIRLMYTTEIYLQIQHTDYQCIIKGRLLRYKRRPFVQ